MVLLHHSWQTFLPDQSAFPFAIDGNSASVSCKLSYPACAVALTPLRLLFSGHAAVGVFFVLSGFVLTKSLSSGRTDYGAFAIRRICRIWLPFAVVICAAAGLCNLIAPQPIEGMPWINMSWNTPVDLRLVAGHLLMLGTTHYESLDNPMWSLVHEMRISLIFPLLVAATILYPRTAVLASIAVFLLFSINRLMLPVGAIAETHLGIGIVLSFAQTARYLMFFVLGILLANRNSSIVSSLASRVRLRPVLWIACAALLWIPYTKGFFDFAYAVGALLLLALCLSSPKVMHWLRRPALVHLGAISYSLYLVHLVVILSLVHTLHGTLPIYWILALAIGSSLVIASVVHRFVELPCNELGKSIARRWSAANGALIRNRVGG